MLISSIIIISTIFIILYKVHKLENELENYKSKYKDWKRFYYEKDAIYKALKNDINSFYNAIDYNDEDLTYKQISDKLKRRYLK